MATIVELMLFSVTSCVKRIHFAVLKWWYGKVNEMDNQTMSWSNLFDVATGKDAHHFPSELYRIASYTLPNDMVLTIVFGSACSFASQTGAIVSACNPKLLPCGGVDKAIQEMGGARLKRDRFRLSIFFQEDPNNGEILTVRCPLGKARIVGPKQYGALRVPYVIHAVGPDYRYCDTEADVVRADQHLRTAYKNALICAQGTPINQIAFSLLSAGVFRGSKSLSEILEISVGAIYNWSSSNASKSVGLKDIVLVAFNPQESLAVHKACDKILAGELKVQTNYP